MVGVLRDETRVGQRRVVAVMGGLLVVPLVASRAWDFSELTAAVRVSIARDWFSVAWAI